MTEEEKKQIESLEPQEELEKVPEAPKETPEVVISEKTPAPAEKPGKAPPPAPKPLAAPSVVFKDQLLQEVEAILEEDLEKVYAELPSELQSKFKSKGDEVAAAILDMMTKAKVKARKVLKLIVSWLKIIPGINKFFLEQEAAIKTQKILAMDEKKKKE